MDRLLTIYCHSLRLNKTTGFQRWPHNFFNRIPRDSYYGKLLEQSLDITKVTNRATYFAISLYRWIYPPFLACFFSLSPFLYRYYSIIESDNTMNFSNSSKSDSFLFSQKFDVLHKISEIIIFILRNIWWIANFFYRIYTKLLTLFNFFNMLIKIIMRYENSCVYYFTRCIRGNITGISFSFFFEATSNIQPPYHGFDWEYTIVPLELKPASVMRNSINSLSSERHIANVYTSPMRRCVSLCRDAEGNLNFWGRGRDMHNKFLSKLENSTKHL